MMLALLLAVVSTLPADALRRVQGESRALTAVEVSERYFSSAKTVVVARADGFADALAGASLAGLRGAPMLFVDRDHVPGAVHQEIRRLGADDVIVLGGSSVVTDRVVRELGARRIAGSDRYATAAAIGVQVDRVRSSSRVFLATGVGYADAVAVAGLAAKLRAPILLTAPDRLPAATRRALEEIDPDLVQVVGGSDVINDRVIRELRGMGLDVPARLAGATRYDTSAQVVRASIDAGLRSSHRLVVSGEGYSDALAAAPAAGLTNRVLAIVPRDNVGPAPFASSQGCDIAEIEIVGGTASVSEVVEERLARAEHGDCSGDPGPDEPWYSAFATQRVADHLDARRVQYGRASLAPSNDLNRLARDWSWQMAREGQLRHNPGLAQQACCYSRVAENVGRHAVAGAVVTAEDLKRATEDLHASWAASAPHRRNLDDPGWTDVGFGIVVRGNTVWATVIFRERG